MKGSRTIRALVVLVLVALPVQITSQPSGPDPQGPEWWGPEEVGEGFHIRVPVTVRNDLDHAVKNGLVMAQADLTTGLVNAGWVHEANGLRDRLASFELDPASIRVVEVRNLQPPQPGSKDGTLVAHDSTLSSDDPTRYEVPSTHVQGFLEGSPGNDFDEATNPIITVLWRVGDDMDPGDERYYMVYLDSHTNTELFAQHTAPDYASTPGGDLLDGLFWSGPGTDFVGYARSQDGAATVQVLGLHDDTEVEVFVGSDGGAFLHQVPLTIGEDQSQEILLGKESTTFRLVASNPILAIAESEGFVPARSGGFVGDEFLFATTYPVEARQDSLYILNRHPTDGATAVELQALDVDGQPVGDPRCVTLSYTEDDPCTGGASSPYPYTLGRRAADQQGQCQFFSNPWNLDIDPAPTTYRARVIEGGPVAIQFDAVRGITPVPALDEGPLGTEFWSVLARRNYPNEPGNCAPPGVVEAYSIFAAAKTATNLEVFSAERTARVFPSEDEEFQVGPIPQVAPDQFTIDVGNQMDRPLELRTDTSSWVMVGRTDEQSLRNVPLRGPLGGGDAGREFAGFGDVILYAPYTGTGVDLSPAGSQESIHFNLAKGRAIPLQDAAGINVRDIWYTLQSDRPLIVLPTGASSGFLAGIPPMLSAEVHLDRTEYRGYLVDIASPTGYNPVLVTTTPDEPAEYTLLVTNRGHGAHGAALPGGDDITVCPEDVPVGWKTTVEGGTGCTTMTGLASGETRAITFKVEAPPDIEARSKAFISVRATSNSNPAVSHAIGTVTQVKSTFGVGLWFDGVDGRTEDLKTVFSADEVAEYTLVVKNLGSVENRITLDFTPPDERTANQDIEDEWVVLLDGQEQVQVTLQPKGTAGDTATYPMQVDPPDDITEGTLVTTVTARSFIESFSSTVTAITTLQGKSELVLKPDNTVAWVEPGGEAVFGFTLENRGDGSTPVFLDVQDDGPPGWSNPQIFTPTPDGGRDAIDRFTILPGDRRPLLVAVGPPSDATAGESDSLRFHVATDTQGEDLEVFLKAIVKPVHNTVALIEGEVPVHVDESSQLVPVTLRLTNEGNLDEVLRPLLSSVPPGWNITFPTQSIPLPRNATSDPGIPTQGFAFQIGLPDGVSKGIYNVSLRLVAEDGHAKVIDIPVEVGSFAKFTTETPEHVLAQPGRHAPLAVHLTNTGNTPVTFKVQEAQGDPWTLEKTGHPLRLPPGASSRLLTGWVVPSTASDSTTTHRFELVAVSDDPRVGTLRSIVETEVDVARADLKIEESAGFDGAAGRIITTTLHNSGTRTAHDVEVHLRVGTETVDRQLLAEMTPGGVYNATLLQPLGAEGTATVIIDPDDTVVEVDETDNTVTVGKEDVHNGRGIPAVAVPTMILGVVAAVAVLRRRLH